MRRSVARPVVIALAVLSVLVILPSVASAACDPFNEYQQRGWTWMYLASFGFGFQTSLTPCVYPMIPITLGIFGARGKDVTRGRALLLATAYVTGMGLTYATLGVIIALIGGQFGTLLANPYVVIPIVLLFAALAASMFGAFELNLPTSWQNRLNQVGGRGFRGAFAMGMVGGLIAAPCTGPFLLGLLTFVATSRSVIGGGSLLFIYAIGMGVLFWVLAAFAMSLPKSGRWMEWVKSAGGILLLLGGVYFLKPLLPFMRHLAVPEVWFLAVSIGVIVLGILAGAIHLSFHGGALEKLRKSVGIALVLAGSIAAWSYKLTPKHKLPYVFDDEVAAFTRARAEGKGVMVDFSATWCVPCSELELTFGDDDVYDLITKNFVPLKFDVSNDDATSAERRARYKAGTLPAVVYISSDGHLVGRVDHMMEPEEILGVLKPAIAHLHAGGALAANDGCK
ncbi:MAG TPA: cytochrome c biogenesis protein CcdA [Kofleriaceae bacterium]|nr:cytochrome c biogenesis protein CcdA [Kofleriaceae bacterium]